MDALITSLLQYGAVGIIAALALILLDRSYKDALRREKEVQENYKLDRSELIIVIRQNVEALTSLQRTVEVSQRAIEALIYDRTGGTRSYKPTGTKDA